MEMKSLVVLGLMVAAAVHGERWAKPSILVLLTDDRGWQDVKCDDIDEPSPRKTPNRDARGTQGVRCTVGCSS